MVLTTENPASNDSFLKKQVMQFDGTKDYTEVPYSATINPAQFTVSCWVKVTGRAGSFRSPITSRDYFKGYMFYAGDNNKWQMWVGNGSSWQVVTGADVVLNTWTHLTGIYDGTQLKFYIDGELAAELTTSLVVNAAYPLRIAGGRTESSRADYLLPGQISDVRIWNKVRTESEIQADMNQRLTGQESGLVGYWQLDGMTTEGGSQQVLDLSSNGNNGTVKEATIVDDNDLPIYTKVMQFDGRNDQIEVPYSATINPAQFTVSCWVKVTGRAGSFRSPITSRDYFKGYMLYAGNNNKWQMWVGNGSSWQGVTGTDVVLNTWTHLTSIYDGSQLKFYIDGEFAAELTTSLVVNAAYPLRIAGGRTESTRADYLLPGQISDVRIWNKVRTESEIQADMHQRLTGQESGLVGYWQLDGITTEGGTQQVLDLSSNGNNGTVNGATIV